ncbi:hypothetical protein SAMN05216287_2675 [Pseudomonas kuykendallii]|uniref:Uncharacterized protein n=1 Tax=Pseudomonas kuykendallii TaxID=1007099 RepID=A0A1H3ADT4_9PSED|nr:hypothetical protein SAMN05216287_2675 [Pseudomonas kuykendallii]
MSRISSCHQSKSPTRSFLPWRSRVGCWCCCSLVKAPPSPMRSGAAVPARLDRLHRPVERSAGRSEPLTHPDPIQPQLWRVGQLHRPALLSPRRQEWDDKGKALGVKEQPAAPEQPK